MSSIFHYNHYTTYENDSLKKHMVYNRYIIDVLLLLTRSES
ncbi:hypothetical protein KSS87_006178 [Heliosperma pusillum]|nr:hypothetical protein KSS87_006178 [Heliosperma pusillum]